MEAGRRRTGGVVGDYFLQVVVLLSAKFGVTHGSDQSFPVSTSRGGSKFKSSCVLHRRDRRGLETQMASDVRDHFVHHLDRIRVVDKISLILYTPGGETLSAWTLVNLLRAYCDKLEIIIPAKCHSAGTLLCLGADNLVMTKQATLGPIDPSVNTPLNPQLPGGAPTSVMPVSVEQVNAFLKQAKDTLGEEPIAPIFDRLAQEIHPLVLGNAYRASSQIRMLGKRLLSMHIESHDTINKILDFLCSESGSHDYTINRREARESLGLPIETPSWKFYELIKRLYDDIAAELELTAPFHLNSVLGGNNQAKYSFRRALIESVLGGTHKFVSEGVMSRQQVVQNGATTQGISDQRQFEGWRHYDANNA